MDLTNYRIIEQHRLFTNTHILELECIFTGEKCYVQRGHLPFCGEISKERYDEIKAKLYPH